MIKLLARDAETGRIGTYQAAFTIPNLMREQKRLPISSVVLSSQRVPMTTRCSRVQKGAAQLTNPLVFDGQKLFPSVTRVFSKSRDMYVFLQAYERGATTTQPLVAFVTFFKGDQKILETDPLQVDRRHRSEIEGRAAALQHPARQARRRDATTVRSRCSSRPARRSPSGRPRIAWFRRVQLEAPSSV